MKILVCTHFNNRSYVSVVSLRCVIFIVPLVQVDTVKRMCIKKLPKVLVIQLKRFDYDWGRWVIYTDLWTSELWIAFFLQRSPWSIIADNQLLACDCFLLCTSALDTCKAVFRGGGVLPPLKFEKWYSVQDINGLPPPSFQNMHFWPPLTKILNTALTCIWLSFFCCAHHNAIIVTCL